jgi:multiple sugar transport system substrate-binding protein
MKKIALVMLALMISSAALFASPNRQPTTGAASGAIRWAFWGNEERIQLTQKAIDAYQAKNPGVKINIEPAGGTGDHFNRVDTQLAGGNGPDIIQMGGNFPDYVTRGILLPLESYNGKGLNLSTLDQSSVDAGSYDGHVYGISVGVTVPALVYNKTLLEKAGVPLPPASSTYAEFRAYLASIKALLPSGVYPMMDFGATASSSTPFGYWLRYNGTPIYDEKTKTSVVTAEVAQKYLDLWKDYRDNGLIPSAEFAAQYPENNTDSSALVAGKVAIGFAVSNQLAGLQAAMTDELGLIELPGAAATKALWPQLSQVMTVNKNSRNIDEAIRFIDFIVNSADAGKILGNNRGASASSTYRAGISGSPVDEKISAYLNIAGPHSSPETAHLPNDTELNSTLYLIYQQVAFGRVDTVAGGRQIASLIQTLITK